MHNTDEEYNKNYPLEPHGQITFNKIVHRFFKEYIDEHKITPNDISDEIRTDIIEGVKKDALFYDHYEKYNASENKTISECIDRAITHFS
jgi:hypothetical protein